MVCLISLIFVGVWTSVENQKTTTCIIAVLGIVVYLFVIIFLFDFDLKYPVYLCLF